MTSNRSKAHARSSPPSDTENRTFVFHRTVQPLALLDIPDIDFADLPPLSPLLCGGHSGRQYGRPRTETPRDANLAAALDVPDPDGAVVGAASQCPKVVEYGDKSNWWLSSFPSASTRAGALVAVSHSLSVLSSPAERIVAPATATHVTAPSCPSKRRSSAPLSASHSRNVLSSEPERMLPSRIESACHRAFVPIDPANLLACFDVPDPDRPVLGAGDDAMIIEARKAQDCAIVPREAVQLDGRSRHPKDTASCRMSRTQIALRSMPPGPVTAPACPLKRLI